MKKYLLSMIISKLSLINGQLINSRPFNGSGSIRSGLAFDGSLSKVLPVDKTENRVEYGVLDMLFYII